MGANDFGVVGSTVLIRVPNPPHRIIAVLTILIDPFLLKLYIIINKQLTYFIIPFILVINQLGKVDSMVEEIKKLSDYSHVRLRTEMYLGSRTPHTQAVLLYNEEGPYIGEMTWVPALFTSFREIFDNSLDEVVGYGHGDRIDIEYNEKDKIFKVSDNGRGIPIDWDESENCHKATLVLSNARAGRNFGERQEVAGTNGIGGSGVNFVSEWFKVEIIRDGKKFNQEFSEGNAVMDELIIKKPILKKTSITKTGTTIEFKLSKEVFKDMVLPEEFIKSRIHEVALANPYITITYNGERIKTRPLIEKSLFGKMNHIVVEIKEETFKSKFVIVPNFVKDGDFYHSIVNNIPAFNGGSHVDQFRRQFFGGLLSALEREGKRRKLIPNRSDMLEGLLVFNVTNMKAPNFDSQSKTRLINEEAASYIKNFLNDDKIYAEIIKKNRDWVEEIFKRCAERTMQKEVSDIQKATKKLNKRKVPKLMEASSPKRSECILFLAEGDSAIAGMGAVRNPRIHAGMPLRGKVLNVNGESPKKVLDNIELMNIMTIVGLQIGHKADRSKLRYGKLYIAHDADPDGANIGALLVNFLYSYWPELFDPTLDPYVHIFLTPFIIAEKGKERRYWYSFNYDEFIPKDWSGWAITRAKGLGSLTNEDWKYSLQHPEAYPLVDDNNLKEALDLIFNNNRADDRKVWISL